MSTIMGHIRFIRTFGVWGWWTARHPEWTGDRNTMPRWVRLAKRWER